MNPLFELALAAHIEPNLSATPNWAPMRGTYFRQSPWTRFPHSDGASLTPSPTAHEARADTLHEFA